MPPLSQRTHALDSVQRVLEEAGISSTPLSLDRAGRDPGIDFVLDLPQQNAQLALWYYTSIAPSHLSRIEEHQRILHNAEALHNREVYPGIVVRRISLGLLERCKELGLFVFDLEGNAFFRLPGIYIERYRPAPAMPRLLTGGTVFTAKASRLIRALLARYPESWTQSELVRQTGISRGFVSIHARKLAAEGYVSNRNNRIGLEEPDRLLEDWVAHYRFDRHQRFQFAISMNTYEQGLTKLTQQLKRHQVGYALTGWSGAQLRVPYAIPQTLMAYVDRPPEKFDYMYPVAGQGNVVLLVPQDAGVFQFATETELGPVVSDAQLYVDLCKMPGRAREQADALRIQRLDFRRMKHADS